MGYGDEVIGTGLAKGAKARGKRVAFGDGKRIIWGPWCAEMFKYNPNIAAPGSENDDDIEWVAHYKGSRAYNTLDSKNNRWLWNYNFKVTPGEFYFDENERRFADSFVKGARFIVVEPNLPWQKSVAPNKDWGEANYRALCDALFGRGIGIVQFVHKNTRRKIEGARYVTADFRKALALLRRADLYIGPEGGMHHGSAALGTKAVVLFGGFIPPEVVGYTGQICLTGGAVACGNYEPCLHCAEAMKRISVDEVLTAAMGLL